MWAPQRIPHSTKVSLLTAHAALRRFPAVHRTLRHPHALGRHARRYWNLWRLTADGAPLLELARWTLAAAGDAEARSGGA